MKYKFKSTPFSIFGVFGFKNKYALRLLKYQKKRKRNIKRSK